MRMTTRRMLVLMLLVIMVTSLPIATSIAHASGLPGIRLLDVAILRVVVPRPFE
jgi:hypothetical protein